MNEVTYAQRKETYMEALRRWGIDAQVLMAIEEMSELTKELCKSFRGDLDFAAISEEIADVTIMLEQLRIFLEINDLVCSHMDSRVRWLRGILGMKIPEPLPRTARKAMLSQPMAGKTEDEIREVREKAVAVLQGKGYTVVNTLFTDEWYSREAMDNRGVVQIPLCFLAKSLENMSLCHAAYFCKNWEQYRGCRIEHEAAVAYGLEIIYEE